MPQKGFSLLFMQINSNFCNTLQISENSNTIFLHLNIMPERKWPADIYFFFINVYKTVNGHEAENTFQIHLSHKA